MVNRKHLSQNVAFGLFRLLSLSVVGILFAILGFIIYKGIGVIDWEFLTTAPTNGMTAGGILPAIVGTFCLMAGSALVAFPVGVMSVMELCHKWLSRLANWLALGKVSTSLMSMANSASAPNLHSMPTAQ